MSPTIGTPSSPGISLGRGEFPVDGPVTFQESTSPQYHRGGIFRHDSSPMAIPLQSPPSSDKCSSAGTDDTVQSSQSYPSLTELEETFQKKKSPLAVLSEKLTRRPVYFERRVSNFMRSADLGLSETDHSFHNDEDEIHANFHHPSVDPPPGMDRDLNETWVALDDGSGSHSPVAPFAVQALAETGQRLAMDESIWTPEKRTEKLLRGDNGWNSCVWDNKGCFCVPPRGSQEEKEVLIWHGCFNHNFYGCELPAVRAFGIVNTSAKALLDLLVDSSRVKEYNKMSLGRKDVLVLQDDMTNDGPFGRSITKVMRSESRPPLLRKVLQFVSLLHAKELNDDGYLIVTRAVTQASNDAGPVDGHASEILLGVNVIRKIEGDDHRCLMITVSHLRSPMVPIMVAKKLGLSAAVNFFNDIRKVCD